MVVCGARCGPWASRISGFLLTLKGAYVREVALTAAVDNGADSIPAANPSCVCRVVDPVFSPPVPHGLGTLLTAYAGLSPNTLRPKDPTSHCVSGAPGPISEHSFVGLSAARVCALGGRGPD